MAAETRTPPSVSELDRPNRTVQKDWTAADFDSYAELAGAGLAGAAARVNRARQTVPPTTTP